MVKNKKKRTIKMSDKNDKITASEAVKVVESNTVIASELNKNEPFNIAEVIEENLIEELNGEKVDSKDE